MVDVGAAQSVRAESHYLNEMFRDQCHSHSSAHVLFRLDACPHRAQAHESDYSLYAFPNSAGMLISFIWSPCTPFSPRVFVSLGRKHPCMVNRFVRL